MEHIGGYIDPLLLLRRIPPGMHIDRLRDRLRQILLDYRSQVSLWRGCNAVLRSDVVVRARWRARRRKRLVSCCAAPLLPL